MLENRKTSIKASSIKEQKDRQKLKIDIAFNFLKVKVDRKQ